MINVHPSLHSTRTRDLLLISIFLLLFSHQSVGEKLVTWPALAQSSLTIGSVFRPTSSVNDLNYHCNRKFRIFSNLVGRPACLVINRHFICYDISTVFPQLITPSCSSDKARLVEHLVEARISRVP